MSRMAGCKWRESPRLIPMTDVKQSGAHTKRRPGSIDRLPVEIRTRIHRLLDQGWTKTDITAAVNEILRADDRPEVSRQAIGRYTQRMEAEGKRIREINAAAEQFAARVGSIQDAGASAYVKQMARVLIVDRLHEIDDETPIEELGKLVLAIRRIEGTSEQIERRAKDAIKRAEEDSAQRAEEAMRGQGLSQESIEAVRARILGAG